MALEGTTGSGGMRTCRVAWTNTPATTPPLALSSQISASPTVVEKARSVSVMTRFSISSAIVPDHRHHGDVDGGKHVDLETRERETAQHRDDQAERGHGIGPAQSEPDDPHGTSPPPESWAAFPAAATACARPANRLLVRLAAR